MGSLVLDVALAYVFIGLLWASIGIVDILFDMPKDLENDTGVSRGTAIVVGVLVMLVVGILFWPRGLWGTIRKKKPS